MHPTTILDAYSNANDERLRHLGAVQSMVFAEGEKPFDARNSTQDFAEIPKGIKQVLWERGLWYDGISMTKRGGTAGEKPCGLELIASQTDFQWERCALTNLIAEAGHLSLFTPKFHPELNPIERAWGRSKWFLRLFCEYTYPSLKRKLGRALGIEPLLERERQRHERLKESLFALPLSLIRKHARKIRDYLRVYYSFGMKEATKEQMKSVKYHRGAPKKEWHDEG